MGCLGPAFYRFSGYWSDLGPKERVWQLMTAFASSVSKSGWWGLLTSPARQALREPRSERALISVPD